MLISSATSLDRYYIPASSISSTLGFISLNTAVFEYNDFKVTRTEPYKPNDTYWLFTIAGGGILKVLYGLVFLYIFYMLLFFCVCLVVK